MRGVLRGAAVLAVGLAFAATPARAQHPIVVALESGVFEHRVTLGETLEEANGLVAGGRVSARATTWLEIHGIARGGRLGAQLPPAVDRTLAELTVRADAFPLPWLGLVATTTLRSYDAALARQRWTVATIGPEARVALYERLVTARVRAAVVPHVAVSGEETPERALAGEVELAYTGARLVAAIGYEIERFDFPRADGARRLEQVSALTARIGWRIRR